MLVVTEVFSFFITADFNVLFHKLLSFFLIITELT